MFDDVEGALGSPRIDRDIAGYRGITSERLVSLAASRGSRLFSDAFASRLVSKVNEIERSGSIFSDASRCDLKSRQRGEGTKG